MSGGFVGVLMLISMVLTGCVGLPAMRPSVDWAPEDHGAVGVALYDSTAPAQIVEGAYVFGAIPLGDIDLAMALQLDFSRGLSNPRNNLGPGGSLGFRYRFKVLDTLEIIPELSAGWLTIFTPSRTRAQAALVLLDCSLQYQVAEQVWAFVRPSIGAGATTIGLSVGDVFPATRLSFGALWAMVPWARLVVEGNVSTDVGGAYLALGVLTVL